MQRYLTLREVSERLGNRSRSAIYADVAAGRLPKPVKLGGRVYMGEADLEAWVRSLALSAAEPQSMKGEA